MTTDYSLDYMGINSLEELPKNELIAEESQLFNERIEDESINIAVSRRDFGES